MRVLSARVFSLPSCAVLALLATPTFGLAASAEKEVKQYEKAVEKDASNPTNWFNLGMAHFKGEEWDAAVTALLKAVELNPQSARSRFHCGEALAKAGRPADAVAQFEAAAAADPTMTAAYINLGQAYLDSKRYDDAITAYKSALKAKPENPDSLYNAIGEAYLRLEDMDQATRWFEKNVEARPNDAVAQFNVGVVYRRLSEQDPQFSARAAAAFVRAAELDPKDPMTLFMAGESVLFAGKNAEAKGYFEKYLAADSDGKRAGAQVHQLAKAYLADLK